MTMEKRFSESAVSAILNSEMGYCKFLSANDTGATGAHQSGILISKTATEMLFDRRQIENESILKRTANITWQDDFVTESCFTFYKSKNELRITKFGHGFPFLKPDQTGALFVLAKLSEIDYKAYFLETDDEIEEFLDTFGISATETNRLIDSGKVRLASAESREIQYFIASLKQDFPSSILMSEAARKIEEQIYDHKEYILSDPDLKLISWTNMEYSLFRALEQARYGKEIAQGFNSVDEFVIKANEVLNRRKSRAGKSLENHLSAIFDGNGLNYTAQAVTEGKKRPDFLFPSAEAYHEKNFPTSNLILLGVKTTCKDRWRQVLNEADKLKGKTKFLFTLQQGVSAAQLDEMQAENLILVVPKPYIGTFPKEKRDRIWTLAGFVNYVKRTEGK